MKIKKLWHKCYWIDDLLSSPFISLENLDKAYHRDNMIHEHNIPVIKNNEECLKLIHNFMEDIGICKEFTKTTKRKRRPYFHQKIVKSAYIKDLERIGIDDNFEQSRRKYKIWKYRLISKK